MYIAYTVQDCMFAPDIRFGILFSNFPGGVRIKFNLGSHNSNFTAWIIPSLQWRKSRTCVCFMRPYVVMYLWMSGLSGASSFKNQGRSISISSV